MATGRTNPHNPHAARCRTRASSRRYPPGRTVADWTRAGLHGRLSDVDRIFTLDQARLLMPDLLAKADDVVAARADLVELQTALNQGTTSPLGGIPEVKALEARLSEILGWFTAEGLDLKGIAPLLLDFPAQLNGDNVLLGWRGGARDRRGSHRRGHGCGGRPPTPDPGGSPRHAGRRAAPYAGRVRHAGAKGANVDTANGPDGPRVLALAAGRAWGGPRCAGGGARGGAGGRGPRPGPGGPPAGGPRAGPPAPP